ncbi:HD-GYP domain-containing protein [Paenibacillus wynnii]|uniref:HD-GYP domain-containing protein n=1 Tax=Paenibacillus wynnii TaxID=268407 RepID=UPI0027920ACA|nr:HD domain-containing phosphohydrolase [Paenibacillus wynnii]MDQ0196365.1 putative nucleotidyltransferase with HDIG domain [Paenibacillus wynnii]
MKVHVMDLKPGDRLKTDTFNNVGLHVLPQGTTIKSEEIAVLIRHSIDYVDIEHRNVSALRESTAFRQSLLKGSIDEAIETYESVFLESLTSGKFTQSMIDDSLRPLLKNLDNQGDVVSLLLMLEQDHANTYNHSLQVGLLSYYLAKWLGHTKSEIYVISRAGYLHDIGKSQVPQAILNKKVLTNAELEELKRHTTYGYEVISNSMADASAPLVALQHHEFEDGSGYPKGILQSEIHPYTRIVAVANIYISMITSRNFQLKQSLITVLRKVNELGFGKLHAKTVQVLIWNMLPNFIGKNVRLSNGETGTIIMNNPTDIFKPLIRVEDQFRDLSRERNLSIDEVFM